MTRKFIQIALIVLSLTLLLAMTVGAAKGTRADQADATRTQNIDQFDLQGVHQPMYLYDDADARSTRSATPGTRPNVRRGVGSAVSPDVGPGIGESIALTWDDHQVFYPVGRHLSSWWNGLTGEDLEVEVHFTYEVASDSLGNIHDDALDKKTGYNVYVASVPSDNWPRAQNVGCVLQETDTIGSGSGANLVMRPSGMATIIADSRFFAGQLGNGDFYQSNMLYYQGAQHNCTYDPRSGLNVTFIDSSVFQPHWTDGTAGNHALYPAVASQVDGGANVVTHVLMAEMTAMEVSGNDYAVGADYRVFVHFRKLGDGPLGSWSAGTNIDTIERNFADMVCDPWGARVAIAYSNPSYYGKLLNNPWDKDVYFRESLDYGDTWQEKVDITNYLNGIPGVHFSMYYEAKALYTSDGNLHVLFQQTPASADPYFDGYNWRDFNQDIAHWDRNSGDYVRVANGTYMNADYLTGSINTVHCGFGGDPATYIQFFNLSQCDDKLFAIWNQTHPWANYGDYTVQPELLEDCAYTGERISMANWEILMSVALISSPTLWDPPRHVSNTFTPDCGLPGDPDAIGGPCGNEVKPYVEHYGLNEAGMDLTWPVGTIVDLTPDGGSYTGNYYLNAEYMDDQFPGPGNEVESNRGANAVYVENSMKWIRIACVEPIEASLIEVSPRNLVWPTWVELGQSNNMTITVRNGGNVMLQVTDVATLETTGSGWLSASITPDSENPFEVTAGVINTATFDVTIDASSMSTTAWLDGEVTLTSGAANFPSLVIRIHVLVAAEVEPVVWDTVITHENMFDTYFFTDGECVALTVGNNGDLGWNGSSGAVNLDYLESETECGTRQRDSFYLIGGSAFTILADDDDGANALLTQVFNDNNQGDPTGFDPIGTLGSITGGLSVGGDYDSMYTGRFVNRDTTIAMERTVYGPRSLDPENEIINFVISHLKVYSGDGQAHSHVTFGNVVDWDIPSEDIPENVSGVSTGGYVYMQGTDTTGTESCQSHTGRFGTEAFGGGYTSAQFQINPCANGSGIYGQNALTQILMEDTTHTRGGTPLTPSQPLADVWWEMTGVGGLNGDAAIDDQSIWTTFAYNIDLGVNDTLHFWSVLTTTRDNTLSDLEAQVSYAKCWYTETVRGCACGCCEGRVGDANGLGTDEPTIGDVSVMIDAKFITGVCVVDEGLPSEVRIIDCLAEGDINQSGGQDPSCGDITIGDISYLIDYLFITGPTLGLNDCL